MAVELWCWRHPRAEGAKGRCIGRTDLPVDARRARRLAHRIRQVARANGLPREAWVSPLRRCRDVGRWLRRWGWRVTVDARLAEVDFGRWDGLHWRDIAWSEVGQWEADLLHHAPGGGESLFRVAQRARAFANEAASRGQPSIVITHGGWMNALSVVQATTVRIEPHDWPAPPPCGGLMRQVISDVGSVSGGRDTTD